jgi:3-hydroxyacyl-[acyl-carrier-protein] dehydratase
MTGRLRLKGETLKASTTIEIDRILQILPHRWPFVLVDRVTEIVAGERIVGHKCVTMGEPWFQGHFPARPIMPGVLIVEALAQIGGISPTRANRSTRRTRSCASSASTRRVPSVVTPDDRLDLQVTIWPHHRTNVWKFRQEASVTRHICAARASGQRHRPPEG